MRRTSVINKTPPNLSSFSSPGGIGTGGSLGSANSTGGPTSNIFNSSPPPNNNNNNNNSMMIHSTLLTDDDRIEEDVIQLNQDDDNLELLHHHTGINSINKNNRIHRHDQDDDDEVQDDNESSSDESSDNTEDVIISSSYDEKTLQQQFYSNMVTEWQVKYLDYKYLLEKLNDLKDDFKHDFNIKNILSTSMNLTNRRSNSDNSNNNYYNGKLIEDFKYVLFKEINKINNFYLENEKSISDEHSRLLEQIEKINEMYNDNKYARSLISKDSKSSKLEILTFNQKQKLKEGIEEHYYNLNLLFNYRLVNYNALIHVTTRLNEITKRRVKFTFNELNEAINYNSKNNSLNSPLNSQISNITSFNDTLYGKCNANEVFENLKFIKLQYFKFSNIIDKHIKDTISYYAEYYCENDTKLASEQLSKLKIGDVGILEVNNLKDIFTSGILLGSLLILITINIYYYFYTYEYTNKESIEYDDQSFSLYRLLLFPTLLSFFISINIRIWSKYNINYVYILGINPLMCLSTWKFLSTTLLILNIIFTSQLMYMMNVVSYLSNILYIGQFAYWHPIILWIILILYLINPFKILNFEFRFWFLKCVMRMLASPFMVVRFSDFFIADQLTSLSDVLFELQFIGCIYPATSNISAIHLFCNSSKSLGIPILNYIPYHVRLMQCLRKYYDTRQKMHLLNALKYFSSCLVIIIAFIDKLTIDGNNSNYGFTTLRIIYIIINIVSTCLKLYWDIHIDMGLFEKKSQYWGLRFKLLFAPQYYYMAMFSNILLRWIWLPFLFVKAFIKIEKETLEWILYLFVLLEIIRRFIWNVFRIEHENIANIENYRATKEIPLPFDTTAGSARVEQVESKRRFLNNFNNTKYGNGFMKALEFVKSNLLCFGNHGDDDEMWIIDEEELEKLRRENAKRPNLQIQLTLPFDLDALRRQYGTTSINTDTTTTTGQIEGGENDLNMV